MIREIIGLRSLEKKVWIVEKKIVKLEKMVGKAEKMSVKLLWIVWNAEKKCGFIGKN